MKLEVTRLNPVNFGVFAESMTGGNSLVPNSEFFAESGIAFGLFANEECFGLVGFFPLWNGVGEGWALMDYDLFKYPIFLRKWIISVMPKIMAEKGWHRIQWTSERSPAHHERWMESIGLTYEGVMKKYTFDKKDVSRWALTV